jgi:hypothetical protein
MNAVERLRLSRRLENPKMPYNRFGQRQWLSLWRYQELYPGENIFYPQPDYRISPDTCKWCGQPLKNKRQSSYCCEDCRQKFQNMTVWGRGTAPLPYRILCRDNFTCTKCGTFLAYQNPHGMYIPIGVGLEVHHRIPVSQGGSDHQSNLFTRCESCHKEDHRGG